MGRGIPGRGLEAPATWNGGRNTFINLIPSPLGDVAATKLPLYAKQLCKSLNSATKESTLRALTKKLLGHTNTTPQISNISWGGEGGMMWELLPPCLHSCPAASILEPTPTLVSTQGSCPAHPTLVTLGWHYDVLTIPLSMAILYQLNQNSHKLGLANFSTGGAWRVWTV